MRGTLNLDREWARAAVAFVVLAWMVGGPFYRQVLGGTSPAFHRWNMFSTNGDGVVDVEFFEANPAGDLRRLDRYQALGYSSPREAPPLVWKLRRKGAVERVARKLCKALGAGADVRARWRIATPRGWKASGTPDRNLCKR